MGRLRRRLNDQAGAYRDGVNALAMGAYASYCNTAGQPWARPAFYQLPADERLAWLNATQFVAETVHSALVEIDDPQFIPSGDIPVTPAGEETP